MRVGFSKPITNKWAIAAFFMFFGLASLTIMAIVLYNQIGSPDMFYLNMSINGGPYERVYSPGVTIFLYSFWGLCSLAFLVGGIAFLKNAIREKTGTFRPPRKFSQEHPRFAEGLVFFIIGLIAVAIPIALVFDNHIADADVETILCFAVCLLFAAPFLVLGTIWMKKRD
ncbi:MAG: hypothetical protein IKW86_03715 [Salinivirgaceae bacterium]|nr:hypothetical protein [Salinivirgaceae bacterium]